MISGAPELIAQMLDKLVANASTLRVPERSSRSAGVGPDPRVLSVSNDGPSAAGKYAGSSVRFHGVDPTRNGGGEPHLGMGLYIVRMIAQFHGGSARAENRADGTGVVMTVELPVILAH